MSVEPTNAALQARVAEVAAMRERGAPTVPTTMALEKVRARARPGGRNGTRARTAHMSTRCSRRCILSPRGRRPTPSSAPTRLRCRSASAWPAARSARCGPRPASEKTTSNESERLGLRGVCSGLTGRSKRRTPGSPTAGASSEARRLWRSPNHDEAAVEVAQPRLVHVAATVRGSERPRARASERERVRSQHLICQGQAAVAPCTCSCRARDRAQRARDGDTPLGAQEETR